jgi:hypothetical protein
MSTLITNIAHIGTIKDAGGNATALTIDSAGRILQPTKPAFSVYQSVTLSAQNYSTATEVPFDTKDFDIGNNVTISTSPKAAVFTAPINGIYHFVCNVMVDQIDPSTYVSITLHIDNATINAAADLTYRYLEDTQGGQYLTGHSSGLIQLTANQTITPHIRVHDDSTANIRDGSRFFGYLVS